MGDRPLALILLAVGVYAAWTARIFVLSKYAGAFLTGVLVLTALLLATPWLARSEGAALLIFGASMGLLMTSVPASTTIAAASHVDSYEPNSSEGIELVETSCLVVVTLAALPSAFLTLPAVAVGPPFLIAGATTTVVLGVNPALLHNYSNLLNTVFSTALALLILLLIWWSAWRRERTHLMAGHAIRHAANPIANDPVDWAAEMAAAGLDSETQAWITSMIYTELGGRRVADDAPGSSEAPLGYALFDEPGRDSYATDADLAADGGGVDGDGGGFSPGRGSSSCRAGGHSKPDHSASASAGVPGSEAEAASESPVSSRSGSPSGRQSRPSAAAKSRAVGFGRLEVSPAKSPSRSPPKCRSPVKSPSRSPRSDGEPSHGHSTLRRCRSALSRALAKSAFSNATMAELGSGFGSSGVGSGFGSGWGGGGMSSRLEERSGSFPPRFSSNGKRGSSGVGGTSRVSVSDTEDDSSRRRRKARLFHTGPSDVEVPPAEGDKHDKDHDKHEKHDKHDKHEKCDKKERHEKQDRDVSNHRRGKPLRKHKSVSSFVFGTRDGQDAPPSNPQPQAWHPSPAQREPWQSGRFANGEDASDAAGTGISIPVGAEKRELVRKAVRSLSWSVDVIELESATGGHVCFFMAEEILVYHGLVAHFHMDVPALRRFLARIEARYGNNSYHHSMHAADVMLSVHLFLTNFGFLSRLKKEQILAALIAALIHDYNHPGTNNAHETKMLSRLAILHSDQSVLEHHHLASAFGVMRTKGFDFLEKLKPAQYHEVRALIIDLVLHTDLARHFDFIQRLETLLPHGHSASMGGGDAALSLSHTHTPVATVQLQQGSSASRQERLLTRRTSGRIQRKLSKGQVSSRVLPLKVECSPVGPSEMGSVRGWTSPFHSEEIVDAKFLLQTAVKFADLGHVTKEFHVHEKWTMFATREFWALGDKQKRLGVALSPLCDREKDVNIPKSQLGFFKFVCSPFYLKVADLVGPTEQPFDRLQSNYDAWAARASANDK